MSCRDNYCNAISAYAPVVNGLVRVHFWISFLVSVTHRSEYSMNELVEYFL